MRKQKIFAMTLLETMITVALFSIVMLLASQALIRGISVWSVSAKETAATWSLQQAMNSCFMDLLKAKILDISPTEVVTATKENILNKSATTIIGRDFIAPNKTNPINFSTVKLQMPVNYTGTGADGQEGYCIVYVVVLENAEYVLYRCLYNPNTSGTLYDWNRPGTPNNRLINKKLLISGIDPTTFNTKIDNGIAPNDENDGYGAMSGFRIVRKVVLEAGLPKDTKEFMIYLRLQTKHSCGQFLSPDDFNKTPPVCPGCNDRLLEPLRKRELISKVYVRNLE